MFVVDEMKKIGILEYDASIINHYLVSFDLWKNLVEALKNDRVTSPSSLAEVLKSQREIVDVLNRKPPIDTDFDGSWPSDFEIYMRKKQNMMFTVLTILGNQ